MVQLPSDFLAQVRKVLDSETDQFVRTLQTEAPVSVLVNPQKSHGHLFPSATGVPWCPFGRYLKSRPSYIMDPLYHGGAYYPMEASSMLLFSVMQSLFATGAPARLLDLCAAPGGKTFVLSSFLQGRALHVANEVNRSRYGILRENVARWGDPNIATCNLDPSKIGVTGFFDCVVVDAPCSGEGLFRKTPEAVTEWSTEHVRHCSLRQRRILSEAARLTAPGGVIIYSTCTYNASENIENVQWLSDTFEFEPIELQLDDGPQHLTLSRAHGYQCWPHRMQGEGFFVAALRRPGDGRPKVAKSVNRPYLSKATRKESDAWKEFVQDNCTVLSTPRGQYYAAPRDIVEDLFVAQPHIPGLVPSLAIGQLKRDKTIPDHSLALSTARSVDIEMTDLSREDALVFLRKESPDIELPPAGWSIAAFEGIALGWIKVAGNKIKNYLPIGLRIRKR